MSVVKKGKRNNQRPYKKRQAFRGQRSSFLRRDHLQDEADDGVGGLVGVQLGEEVADVVGCASLLTRNEPKQPKRRKDAEFTMESKQMENDICKKSGFK